MDHSVLLQRLQRCIGIDGTALKWCSSYLSGRNQRVCIGDSVSDPVYLNYSVPQGSVLGPKWFLIHIVLILLGLLFLGIIFLINSYADDDQIYMSFKPSQSDAYKYLYQQLRSLCLRHSVVDEAELSEALR